MMMSFCRKSVHSFLGFTTTTTTDTLATSIGGSPWNKSHHSIAAPAPDGLPNGLGLITAVSENVLHKSPNVLESASVNKPISSLPKKDPGGIGFIDDIGGGVDGLMSCTESLGFESSDERLVDDVNQMEATTVDVGKHGGDWRTKARRSRVAVKKFPPPLSSLNQHGHPKFYLRPVRKDGRLELTEIRIERPEILRACREDGRLRLHLIRDEQDKDEGPAEEEKTVIAEEHEQAEEEEEGEVEAVDNIVKEKEGKWANNPVTGEGFRRCIEVINHHRRRDHHHHHHLDVWRQHCVTTS